jgi:hypothetical protein
VSVTYFQECVLAPSWLLCLLVFDLLAEAASQAFGLTSPCIGNASPEDVVLSAFDLAID